MKEYEFDKCSLLDPQWIKENAEKSYKDFWERVSKAYPEVGEKGMEALERLSRVIFYAAYEDALNIFICQIMEDTMHEVSVCIDELGKLTAEIMKKGE